MLIGAALRADDAAARLILVANSDDPDSVRLARYYAERRGVPAANILSFRMPQAETITWPEFVASIWQPLQDELIRAKWIDAATMDLFDDTGRRKRAPRGHRISYLVLCRGVPLRIDHSPALYHESPTLAAHPEFRTNQASVDSELALLAQGAPPINGFVTNPLFARDRPGPFEEELVVKITRLDGPTYDDARALVDSALVAEKNGLIGRAYVDVGGITPEGDRWLESTAAQLAQLGFPLDVDRAPTTLAPTVRCDAPALYFGWYAADLNGPFALPGFRFPPGAIALHIHSFSARTLRSATEGWCGPLVARGVAATVGNVFEPYLQFTHEPQLLLRALADGMNFGDAAAYAVPVLSWQGVAIGDPLYRPFAVRPDQQLSAVARLSASRAGYVVLRQVALLEGNGKTDEALALLRRTVAQRPSLALAEALAGRLEQAGDKSAAAAALHFATEVKTFRADEWALGRQLALHLQALGAGRDGIELWKNLLASPTLPADLRAPWLEDAHQAAITAGDAAQAEAWEKEAGADRAGTSNVQR